MGKASKLGRAVLAGDQRLDYCPPTYAQHIRNRRVQLDVSVLERLLYPQDVSRLLTHQLLPGTQQGTHLLGLAVWDEARPDQTVRQQICYPVGVLHVVSCAQARSSHARHWLAPAQTHRRPRCATPASSKPRSPLSRSADSCSGPATPTMPSGRPSSSRTCEPLLRLCHRSQGAGRRPPSPCEHQDHNTGDARLPSAPPDTSPAWGPSKRTLGIVLRGR